MSDISDKISNLLDNPEILEKILNITGTTNKKDENLDENTVKLLSILSSTNKNDKYISFLDNLKPLLKSPRKEKIDESIKLLQLIKILKLVKNKERYF
ncbi:MAG: hypothetical protein RsTaC01_1060 [Candidatus Paraimprobicoccus trichonymphae]|uniref:Uncharacterized protein n=1 Tax=Candidatus Paraimprobicoccus trichonymphae TaxID=3033793 RepID=A0AA48IHL9_9FIRM|nr:MAG: hypothetical protein RsTaC01_1060 [Candidatus Paraimprobicoccus trichonymphae]